MQAMHISSSAISARRTGTTGQLERSRAGGYGEWVAACVAGEVVGIGVAAAAAISMDRAIGEPRSWGARLLILAVFAAVGAVEGGALGALQWRVLRATLRPSADGSCSCRSSHGRRRD